MVTPLPRSLPRVVVAAPASGHGKTTVATGLMAALTARGLVVSPHKVGPDYIDPGYHALATGRPGRNLDPFLVGADRIAPLLLHGGAGADVAVLEGVMGLYDGRLGTGGEASTAHVAALTGSPVLLVVDVSHASRTHAATVAGLAAFDPRIRIGGVVLNRAGSSRHADEVGTAIRELGLPVLGSVPRDADLQAPSRHLGLVPVAERSSSTELVARLADVVTRHLDLDAVLDLARSADTVDAEAWSPETALTGASPERFPDRQVEAPPVIAVAAGPAFTFGYAEHAELLRAAGCEPVPFDPLTAEQLPAGTAGLVLGGGFPEEYADRLAANTALLSTIRDAVEAGVPTTAECAGMLALCRSLDGRPMAGVLDAVAEMTPRLALGYREATALTDSPAARSGQRVTGHEFHRTRVMAGNGSRHAAAWALPGGHEGFAGPSVHASYLHLHPAGHPGTVARFAAAVRAARGLDTAWLVPRQAYSTDVSTDVDSTPDPRRPSGQNAPDPRRSSAARARSAAPVSRHPDSPMDPPADPLRHHGDQETGEGLLDFAVNVYPGPRPAWLDRALHSSLDGSHAYPDPTAARQSLAARHGRPVEEVLSTAGAAEAFSLVARMRAWRRPVVVHPQFTEPHAALEQAGFQVTPVFCHPEDGFRLRPETVPDDADLVVVGNPTNPTGVLHPAQALLGLVRPGRVVLVDEAFLDAIPGEPESLAADRSPGLLVTRSLTKHWSIPGIRAGYLLGESALVAEAARQQTPWSVSAPALAAMVACSDERAAAESGRRAESLGRWRTELTRVLTERGLPVVPGPAPFLLARVGEGVHARLRAQGVAVRRADTFPGLDGSWVRIAARPPEQVAALAAALDRVCLGPMLPEPAR